MKSFNRAITIAIVLTLMLAGSTTAQTAPAPAQTVPATAGQQAVNKIVEDTTSNLNETLRQLINARAQQYGSRSRGVLVIPTAEIKPQDVVTVMEDMTVMCRIFEKKLAQSHLIREEYDSRLGFSSGLVLSIPFSSDSRSTGAGAMYVQGYGALFMTKVDFLLSPPPKAQEEKKTEEEDTDPLWTETKQEIYAPEEVSRRSRTDDRSEEKYDAEKVENLKTTLIKALKHAANIRAVKSDESVILTVTGKGSQSAGVTIQAIGRGEILVEDKYNKTVSIVEAPSLSDIGFSSPTVLVIRAKKSDIETFAKGQYDFDQFRQRTQLLLYPFLGASVGGPSRSSPTNVIYGGSSNRRIR